MAAARCKRKANTQVGCLVTLGVSIGLVLRIGSGVGAAVSTDIAQVPRQARDDEKVQWHPEQVPNPYQDPHGCRLEKPGWLCDPNGFLSLKGRNHAMDIMVAIREETSVQCPDGDKGYQVGAAIINNMHVVDGIDNKASTAAKFAKEIGDNWGVGDPGCGNGIMLFMSMNDRFAFIKTAQQSQLVLSDELSELIVSNMKGLLREGDYDSAVLQAMLQIMDVLQGNSIPNQTMWWHEWVAMVCLMFALGCVCFFPLAVLICGGFLTCILLPLAKLLDMVAGCKKRAELRKQEKNINDDLLRVQTELESSEQTLCPICLDQLLEKSANTTLECKHNFHTDCLNAWLANNKSCPLCRAHVDVHNVPICKEEEGRPKEYQDRLRFYLSRLQHRHPNMFETLSLAPYHRDPGSGNWVFSQSASERHRWTAEAYPDTYRMSLMSRYRQTTTHVWNSWMSSSAQSSNRRSGHYNSYSSGTSVGGFGGGGGFSAGGGGGGGW